MKKAHDFLTPYEKVLKQMEKPLSPLFKGKKQEGSLFIDLSKKIPSCKPKVKDKAKRRWLEDVAFPYMVGISEKQMLRVELRIDKEELHGCIICKGLDLCFDRSKGTEWKKLYRIMSRTSRVLIYTEGEYIVTKLYFQLHKGEQNRNS